jgi:spore coat polysaccharide biosynthesis protein SpsF
MIIAVLQARFSSSRLPGKVLKLILDKPMLACQIERIQRASLIDKLIVATSNLPADNPIANLCLDINIECFRGSLDDVLDRFYSSVHAYIPDQVIRLTGDCPLCDPILIDQVVQFHINGRYDYSCNTINPTYPDGLDVEVLRYECLELAHREAILPSHREHVTQFIHQQPERFKIGEYYGENNLSQLRWTVDEPLDLELVIKIYESLYPKNPDFTTENILDWLVVHPEWRTHNTQHIRNEGLIKSLLDDQAFLLNNS